MKKPNPFVVFSIGFLFLMGAPHAAAEKRAPASTSPKSVTAGILAAKIKEIEGASDQREEVKTKLVKRYRKALSNLEEAKASTDRATAFQNETKTAPEQTQLIREQIKASESADPIDPLGVTLEMPLEQIERQLQKEQADLAAVDARRVDFESGLAGERNRPSVIRQRLAEGAEKKEAIAGALRAPSDTDEIPSMIEAKIWVLQTKNAATECRDQHAQSGAS